MTDREHEIAVRDFFARARRANPKAYADLVRRTKVAASNEERRRKGRKHAVSLEGLLAGYDRF
jgi:hypothetical protein